MKKIIRNIIIFYFILSVFACSHHKKSGTTKILGKIINPKKREIVISHDPFNVSSDTLYIHSGNKFFGEINIEKEGLHYLFVFPEFQVMYIKPGDSIAFVLNTTEFDESLSFSGTSGFENNLLIELFLANEKENMQIRRELKDLSPRQLDKKLDSFYKIKQALVDSYKPRYNKTSRQFKKTVDLYNKVPQYRIRENYLRQHKEDSIPAYFTKYRDFLKKPVVDANLPDLLYFAKTYIENRLGNEEKKDFRSYHKAADLINAEIADPDLRDNILMIYCKNYIIGESVRDASDSVFQKYAASMKSSSYVSHCKDFINKNTLLAPSREFPDIQVIDANKKFYNLHDILQDNKSILSYWDIFYRSNFTSNLKKLKSIKEKNPGLQIIILNDNPEDFEEWKLQIPQDSAFKFYQIQVNGNEIKKFLPYGLNQVFLLDSTRIKQSMINLYDANFQNELNDFINP